MAVLVGVSGLRCRKGRLAWLSLALLVMPLVAMPAAALSYFTAFDNSALQRFVGRFGNEARPRLGHWREQIATRRQAGMSERQQLEFVNRLANKLPYAEDLQHWGLAEYWATPAEFVASDSGDCDDYAISKYFALIELGMAPEKLRITYVRALYAKGITHHMVLAYYPQPEAEPLILDNLVDEILPAGRRPDLVPVLSFNDAEAWSGRGARERKVGVGVVRQWSELRQRMQKEGMP